MAEGSQLRGVDVRGAERAVHQCRQLFVIRGLGERIAGVVLVEETRVVGVDDEDSHGRFDSGCERLDSRCGVEHGIYDLGYLVVCEFRVEGKA